MINVKTWGSFPDNDKTFGPADYGHANVVAQVIEWLAVEVLPEAIALDHRLQAEGNDAPKGWARPEPNSVT
jgi:hypothetical protein